jgi:hypothetical protein
MIYLKYSLIFKQGDGVNMFKQRKLLKLFSASVLFVAIMAPVFSFGCVSRPGLISAELGQQVELRLGQAVNIAGEQLEIKFAEVIGDSRCPTGATCVWQGEVTCILEITYLGETYTKTITQPGLSAEMSADVFQEYEIDFSVLPYPELDKDIKTDDYRLQLLIEKAPLLTGGILVTFDVEGEEYKIFVENEETIADILAVERGESQATIPSGKIIGEPVFYNAPWSWHIDPVDIQMAEFTIEVCSGLPSHVENDLDYWVNTVGRFCPWSAEIVEIRDFR